MRDAGGPGTEGNRHRPSESGFPGPPGITVAAPPKIPRKAPLRRTWSARGLGHTSSSPSCQATKSQLAEHEPIGKSRTVNNRTVAWQRQ
jgi:hypothetical protein